MKNLVKNTNQNVSLVSKIAYYDKVLTSKSTYNVSQIAKELGMSAIRLNKELRERKVQYKQRGVWLLYSKYQNKGYTDTYTRIFEDSFGNNKTSMRTVWTEAGRRFIHRLLKA